MEKVVDLDSHREDEIANEDELDDELFDALSDLSIKMCEPTEELFEDEEETIMENEKAKTSMAENLEKIFDGFTSKINSEEFSEKLADSLYLNLFGQKSFDKMKDKQAKKKVKAEDREARKETGEATFTEKISDKFTDFLKFHPRKAGTIIVGCTAIFVMGIGYSLSRR